MQGELPIFLRDVSDKNAVKQYVDLFIRECERDPNRVAFLKDADDGFNLLIDNANWHCADNAVPLPVNRIRPAITALVAAQVNDPYAIKFNARELGEPATYFIDPRSVASPDDMAKMGIGPEFFTGDNPKPRKPSSKIMARRPMVQP